MDILFHSKDTSRIVGMSSFSLYSKLKIMTSYEDVRNICAHGFLSLTILLRNHGMTINKLPHNSDAGYDVVPLIFILRVTYVNCCYTILPLFVIHKGLIRHCLLTTWPICMHPMTTRAGFNIFMIYCQFQICAFMNQLVCIYSLV